MAILKCKMCGGDIEANADKTFGTCDSCGSVMTLPKVSDEQRAAAFNRGNHFRRAGEFDKALAVYEHIIAEDDTDAEAHWCCALCRFGIEYVEDPASYEWVPTCHRVSLDSFLEDVDYIAAIEYSDGVAKRQYQREAVRIAEVQRAILATSQNMEPFDVFICYKESDESGNRTRDSLMAQDVYYQLVEKGFRVFFSRITLEDVAGTQYEPYIFAALNSARVMIVIGTSAANLNAVWVKNEWSRYLALMKKDRGRLLLPCYRDMDPYDLPEQLSVLQSYDIAKIGFVQDLIRGVKKVVDAGKAKPMVKVSEKFDTETVSPSLVSLQRRGLLFLEDGDWDNANSYFDRVLDIDPEYAPAYVGKLCAELRVHTQDDLQNCDEPFDKDGNYRKALRFGDEALKAKLTSMIEDINARIALIEENRRNELYLSAQAAMDAAKSPASYLAVAISFDALPAYRDADMLAAECRNRMRALLYSTAQAAMDAAKTEADFRAAAKMFDKLSAYRDADMLAAECRNRVRAFECKQKELEQSNNWAAEGLCRYCGGTLNILGKCKSCGKWLEV